MPVAVSYPGVYIEELPSGVRTITGVATSIAAFVGYFRRGPLNEPVQIFSVADFTRIFGGLDRASETSYAVQQFFFNGGSEAWVVRTASGAFAPSEVTIENEGGGLALTVTAISPGVWGDGLRVGIDYPEPTSGDRFNFSVDLFETRNGIEQLVQSETFNGLEMATVETLVNDPLGGSRLVRVQANGADRPRQTGTVSGVLPGVLSLTSAAPAVNVTIGTEGTATATLTSVPASLGDARTALEAAIRAANPGSRAFAEATVSVVDSRLRVRAGPTAATGRVTFAAAGPDPTFGDLGLDAAVALQGMLSDDIASALPHGGGEVDVTIGGTTATLTLGAMADLEGARSELEAQIRAAEAAPEFAAARVGAHTDGAVERLVVLAGAPATTVAFAATGSDATTAGELELDAGSASVVTASVSADITPVPSLAGGETLEVTIGADGPHPASIAGAATDLAGIASQLQAAIRAANAGVPAFDEALVAPYVDGAENRLIALTAASADLVTFAAAPTDATTVTELALDIPPAFANVQRYQLGLGAIANTAQSGGAPGNDGDPTAAVDLIGDLSAKTGLFALEDVDLFNILSIPRSSQVTGDQALDADLNTALGQAVAIMTAAINYCERRRAFFILDPPNNLNSVQAIKDWLDANGNLRRANAGLYFPQVQIPDPLDGFRGRRTAPSGTIAGLYARTDAARGVWKAPAGTEGSLTNVQQLAYRLTDAENGTLNPLAINALRDFPVFGRVSWGARTLVGADAQASQWKYIPVRRLALFLEESLYRGTQWVVFEPNDEPLWAQIRLNIGAFMQSLFLQGAFQGTTPRQAYLVKCDSETTTQDDINRGIVNILVGFAPLRPAEFVIIQIQQLAGQLEA